MGDVDVVLEKNTETFEPGAARFGNFINYYSFNCVLKRLEAIPPDFFSLVPFESKSFLCLDIGCNSGDLTVGLYHHLVSTCKANCEIFILGIDLDATLITRCNEANQDNEHIAFQQIDIMKGTALQKLKSFLQEHNRPEFDLITCFSTSMWIHLNHGDAGLDDFLRTISQLTKYFLIEPQEWKSYKSAVRRMSRVNHESFAIQNLKTRDIIKYLIEFLPSECSMTFNICFGNTSWGRKMFLFEKKCICTEMCNDITKH